jgi:EAL domain-containing protein (putative c-di-GMP-specific phosphodiesterase class I)
MFIVLLSLSKTTNSGGGIHIDDFGTRYSSLSYLHKFSINVLKIDRSFIRRMAHDIQNTEIVKTIKSDELDDLLRKEETFYTSELSV